MEALLIALAAAGTIAGTVAMGMVGIFARPWLVRQRGRRLVVHQNDDRSLEGTLLVSSRDGVVLAAVKYLDESDAALAGDIYVPRSTIAFIQIP